MLIPAFLEEPSDIHVKLGGNATFPCLIDGTAFEPSWRINGTDYTPSLVPMQYQTGGQRITIKNVTWTENGLTFQCFIIVKGGQTLESTVGHIISKLHLNF